MAENWEGTVDQLAEFLGTLPGLNVSETMESEMGSWHIRFRLTRNEAGWLTLDFLTGQVNLDHTSYRRAHTLLYPSYVLEKLPGFVLEGSLDSLPPSHWTAVLKDAWDRIKDGGNHE